MNTFDAILIGSGHNALITAAYLARAGWSVLVLERNDRLGGLTRTDELTLPGFRHDVYSSAHPLFVTSRAFADLGPELAERGLRYLNTDLPTGVSLPDGRSAILSTDFAANIAEFERLAPGDGAAFAQMMEEFNQHAGPIFGLFNLDLASAEAAPLIEQLMRDPKTGAFTSFAAEFLLSARDVLDSRFRSEVVRALMGPWVMHLGRTPDAVNSGIWVPLVLAALMGGGMPTPEGGSEMLARSLVRLIRDNGGELRTESLVEQIEVRRGRAVGVRTADGETYRAKRAVVASTNPDQLYLKLLAGADVPPPIKQQAARYRYGRGCFQLHLALSEPPRWADERMSRVGQPHLSNGLEGCALAITEALNGLLPTAPTFTIDTPSVTDPSRAPAGKAVMRVQLLEIPCRPRGDAAGTIDVGDGSWTDDLKQRFAERVIQIVGQHLPNVPDAILGMHSISPDDLARFSPNLGPGDPYGGVHDLAQSYMLRPLPGQPSHRTAVPNVYMLGAATWPGHGINGGSGYIVAQQLLSNAN
jgi:phytoene dehydrogenase-like protein